MSKDFDNVPKSKGNTLCPMPWNSINLRNNGDLRICCNTNSYSPQRGIMKKEDGTPYNAGRDDFNVARNAGLLKDVRKTMMAGDWHPECERCRQEEVNGIRSRREYETEDWGLSEERIHEVTEEDGTLDVEEQNIDFFDIRYGNFCNLKCRMCGPTDSHKWYDDFVKVTGRTHYKDTHDVIQLTQNKKGKWATDQYDWFKNADHYWEQFDKYCTKAKKLYIVGGEPLIIAEHQESLEKLVASGNAHEIQLEYNTNLTMVPDRLVHLWEKFKQIRIGVSIDGCNEVFDYQRTPAKFPAVYKHMKTLNDNPTINLKAWFAFTVTPMNVYHMPEFMKWKLEESGLSKFNPHHSPRPTITQHMCHSPKYYNIKVLPEKNKREVVELYEEYKDWVKASDHPEKTKRHFCTVLDSTVRFMLSEDYSEEWLGEFVKITKKLDEARDQNILDIVPEYKDLFDA